MTDTKLEATPETVCRHCGQNIEEKMMLIWTAVGDVVDSHYCEVSGNWHRPADPVVPKEGE